MSDPLSVWLVVQQGYDHTEILGLWRDLDDAKTFCEVDYSSDHPEVVEPKLNWKMTSDRHAWTCAGYEISLTEVL